MVIARTVVYRHPCDCDSASRPLGPGETAEHRFEVDGEPFPWHITEDGATFRKHSSGLYQVSCTVIPVDRTNNELLPVTIHADHPVTFEYIDGTRREFPWYVTGPVFISAGDHDIPLIALTFIADDVDTDTEVAEEVTPQRRTPADYEAAADHYADNTPTADEVGPVELGPGLDRDQ